jgi:diadenosine tetraphosphate (Ap4A) HIT family hydrolase
MGVAVSDAVDTTPSFIHSPAPAVDCGSHWTSVNLAHAAGVAAWQSVFHFHLHAVPLYGADELRVMWPTCRSLELISGACGK